MRKIIYSIALLVLCLFNGSVFAQGVQQLWGTTTGGGTDGLGAIISASANGTNYQLRSSFNYTAQGRIPLYSDLIYYNSKMYGMTSEGGTNNAGVIFEWDPATNNYTKKIDLTSSNGYFPRGSLLLYNNKMYGMTISGGTNGAGVIFEWDPATNIYTKKIDLSSTIGSGAYGSLILYNNRMYGLTSGGGINGVGVIFEWDPATNIYTKKIDLSSTIGSGAYGNLIVYNNKMYGMTNSGGVNNSGVIFEWVPATNIYTKKIDLSVTIGSGPTGSLLLYNNKMYGLTTGGGVNSVGVIFEWDPATNIYTKKTDLSSTIGSQAFGSLAVYNNKMYGMTYGGGASGEGVVFEWDPATNIYTKKIDLQSFTKGSRPQSSLLLYNNKLYGMTELGGNYNYGVIFEWDPAANNYTKKINMDDRVAYTPIGNLVSYNNKMYGMTVDGGTNNAGVIFEWDAATNTFAKKIDMSTANGSSPFGSLVVNNNKMYGMTYGGGVNGVGVIFEWDPATNIYTKKIDLSNTNGAVSYGNSLVIYNNKMYGMTYQGGANSVGVIFEWDPATNIYTKKIDLSAAIGARPQGSLVVYNNKMYGMTYQGGANNVGVIFEWNPATNIYTKKIDLNATSGSSPIGSLIVYNNKMYGMTYDGGANSNGVIFEWDQATNIYTKKIDLSSTIGARARGSMIINNNKLYGMTYQGGANSNGVIFEWDPATNTYIKRSDLISTKGNYPYGDLLLVNAPVAKGSPPVCESLPIVTIDNTNNNVWVPILDSKGDIAAEIKANGNNLGNVSTDLFTRTGACREDNSYRLYLNRNITITPQTAPSSNVDVRLYIRKSELDTIKVAMNSQSQPSGVASINEIDVFKNNNTCSVTVGNAATPLTATNGTYGVDYYLQASVSSFSTFYFANKALVAILPVQLFSFNGIHQSGKNLLQWKASCYANTVFTLQRSKNGNDFENIGLVNGTTADINKVFEFNDNTAGDGRWYYRLLIEETGVQQKYSQTINLGGNIINGIHVEIAPNPVNNGWANVEISATSAGTVYVKLFDIQGKLMHSKKLNFSAGFSNNRIDVSNYANGVYHLVFSGNNGSKFNNKLVIIR